MIIPDFHGLVKEINDYILRNSISPQPNLAICAAIAVMSGAASKAKLCLKLERIRAYPRLFLVMAAPTGAGKDFPMRVCEEILGDPTIDALGSGDYRSSQGVYHDLDDGVSEWHGKGEPKERKENHCRMDTSDEFIEIFKRANFKDAAAHQSGILDTMCKLFSATGKTFHKGRAVGRTDGPSKVKSPCLGYLGTCTINDIERHIGVDNIEKGIVPRFLFFTAKERVKHEFNLEGGYNGDEHIKSIIKEIDRNMMYIPVKDRDYDGWYNMAPRSPEGARAFMDEIDICRETSNDLMEKNPGLALAYDRALLIAESMCIGLALARGNREVEVSDLTQSFLLTCRAIDHSAYVYNKEYTDPVVEMMKGFEKSVVDCAKDGYVMDVELRKANRAACAKGLYDRFLTNAIRTGLLHRGEDDFSYIVNSTYCQKDELG